MLGSVLHLSLPWFEGTLDTLLTLAEQAEVDIASLALAEVVEHCLAVVRREAAADAELLAGLIAVVSRLMVLKSAALLPRPLGPTPEPVTEAGLGGELAQYLGEYRVFKQVAEEFRQREREGLRSYPRLAAPPPSLPAAPLPTNVTLDRLLAIVQEALRRRPPDPPDLVPRLAVTVAERLAALEEALKRDGQVSFARFIAASRTRIEVVVGFMAVLELIKRERAVAEQREPFGDILIIARSGTAVAVPD